MTHTIIVSDIHLTEAEPAHPGNALWKRYKRPRHFVDRSFERFLVQLRETIEGRIELVLDGDIFDFDAVMALPLDPTFRVSWLERLRGLEAEEPKSCFKIDVILRDHKVWVAAMHAFLASGHNRVVFVIGNHDMELNWPSVQRAIRGAFCPLDEEQIRFCEWFYVSEGDTLIEHGHMYDAYTLCNNPIRPFIKKRRRDYVRLPFGNLAGKLMLNGMGLFNPHVESSFVMSFWQYIVFFFKYVIRIQPFLIWTWFWGAMATLLKSLDDGLRPAIRDPLTFESRIDGIAERSKGTPGMVLALYELRVHPAIFNPWKILQELWLDRALLFGGVMFVSFNAVLFVNALTPTTLWWVFAPLGGLLPIFIFYAQSVQSDVYKLQKVGLRRLAIACQIAKVKRTVQGHTHREVHTRVGDYEYLNTGTWSPAFHDAECRRPFGRKCFVWLRPDAADAVRRAELYHWTDPGWELIPSRARPMRKREARRRATA